MNRKNIHIEKSNPQTWKEQTKQIGRNTLKKMCSKGTTVNKAMLGIPDILLPDFRIRTSEYWLRIWVNTVVDSFCRVP